MRRILCIGLLLAASLLTGCSSPVAVGDKEPRQFKIVLDGPGSRAVADEGANAPQEAKPEKATEFPLPKDRAGELLGKALSPRPSGPLARRDRPAPPAAPMPRVEEPPLPAGVVVASRMPEPARKPLRPRLVTEEGFPGAIDEPRVPKAISFDPEQRVSVQSEDMSIPPALPVMAQPLADRVPLEDFTTEASTQAVQAAAVPSRDTPTPFSKAALSDPFENRKPLNTTLPDEESAPVVGALTPPKP